MYEYHVFLFREGKISAIGDDSKIKDIYIDNCEQVYDASNQCIIPGIPFHNDTV